MGRVGSTSENIKQVIKWVAPGEKREKLIETLQAEGRLSLLV